MDTATHLYCYSITNIGINVYPIYNNNNNNNNHYYYPDFFMTKSSILKIFQNSCSYDFNLFGTYC